MPSRRKVLSLVPLVTLGPITGCSSWVEDSKSVDVLLHNDDKEPWELTVVVARDAGEQVFETTETVPADDGVNLGKRRIESAFEGTRNEQFTVRAWLAGEPAGTFEYGVTCPEDNYVALLVRHQPNLGDGEPLQYNSHWCAN